MFAGPGIAEGESQALVPSIETLRHPGDF